MKVTVKKVVICYKTLGEAKVTKLEESEVIKIVKARKMMRQIADDYEAFLKDIQEKFKPENWDEIQKKIQ
jgi:DNA-binding ferritin-like protein